ncbi:ribonuclease HIII [Lottiidibacillus patelloidae]|uniref:Ribonuclease HIII n=1 Tax=Lottiidibacillus patelloidae TaxID=2670334 RepID=A0A263BXM3_9BACI|nr:ribonuclease HIII [Lottiidibacillus patelloidae]OZM57926.1 ribonuclease HIII [Lottiidibacillus patelloidae]
MANSVITVNAITIEKMKDHYKPYLTGKTPQGAVFAAKVDGCSITAYKSGKVLFQGKEAESESGIWGISNPKDKKKVSTKKVHNFAPPKNIGTMSIIGSDEVGTGDYFGPITVVASYVSSDHIPTLQALGVKDSKNLTDPQIIEIAKILIKTIPYSLLTLHNPKYNELQKKGYSQGKMKALLHNQAINHLLRKIEGQKLDGILIDQFAEPGVYFNYLKAEKSVMKENVYLATKAEGIHLSVASSSIIARYAFLKEMDELSTKAGFTIPKGAGSHVDNAAAKLIKQQGAEALWTFTKHHFANTEKAKKIAEKI